MKQVLVKQGSVAVEEVPAPQVEPGTVLVQVLNSCISAGTEMSGIRGSSAPLWKRVLKNPDKVKQLVQMTAAQGVGTARHFVENKIASITVGTAIGYSAAGIVLEVGEGIDDLAPGDHVACAGVQFAHHAEIIRVPRNLTVPVPEGLDITLASTVTLGAIALQGVRRAQPTLGEIFVVIGLGVLGQVTSQLLHANGCRVIGSDLVSERIQLAQRLGMDLGLYPEGGRDAEQVARLTDGIGADGVIITAATPSSDLIAAAFQMCRKKGRVVLVGDVGLNLNRADIYEKELDFFISTSYGPGRYDRRYEEKGLDYPVAYVRWTENRNMAEYLRLVAEHRIDVQALVGAVYPVDQAAAAYGALESGGENRPLIVLLAYPRPVEERLTRVVANPALAAAAPRQVRLGVIGAGDFAREMHLPNLMVLKDDYYLRAVMSREGDSAAATGQQFGAAYSTTDYAQILNDPEVDAVLIATRHNTHARLALEALRAGKHVLVEKPLALTQEELAAVQAFYEADAKDTPPVLLTGFNRRFSVYARRIHELVQKRTYPMIINYRMNAGYIPSDHWTKTAEGGGRNLGEACHIYDLFTYLTSSRVITVDARTITPKTGYYSPRDNFVATLTFEDGSLATLTYTALGSTEFPKERMEIYLEGKVIALDNYQRLTVTGAKVSHVKTPIVDKGHKDELQMFARAIRQGGDWPIPLWQQLQATAIALRVEEQLKADPVQQA